MFPLLVPNLFLVTTAATHCVYSLVPIVPCVLCLRRILHSSHVIKRIQNTRNTGNTMKLNGIEWEQTGNRLGTNWEQDWEHHASSFR
jgi:hypothetical protein